MGDTRWDWTNRNITFESFKNLADTRSSQGYNLGQLFFAANGWGREKIVNTVGEEDMRRWWRYVIHRLHDYNVIWVLAGEYNMNNYGGLSLDFWNSLGELVKSEDPYERITSAHPTTPMWEGGAEAPQWSTAEAIHDKTWFDYNQSQCGHARWCNELIPEIINVAYSRQPAKPVVVTELRYEFIEENPSWFLHEISRSPGYGEVRI
jgi:hypothetical protein